MDARQYKGLTKNTDDSSISVQSANGYSMIGPFNVSFSGKKIEKIYVQSSGGSKVGVNGGDIYFTTYNYPSVDDAIADRNNMSNLMTEITSGDNFYIIVDDSIAKGDNLKVTFSLQPFEYYYGRMVLALNPLAKGQNFIIYAASEDDYVSELTFNVSKPVEIYANLEIVKKDQSEQLLSGVGFYLVKHEGANVLYGRWDSNNSNTYTGVKFFYDFIDPNEPDKYVFKTGGNGELCINGLDTADIFSVIELRSRWNNANYSKCLFT